MRAHSLLKGCTYFSFRAHSFRRRKLVFPLDEKRIKPRVVFFLFSSFQWEEQQEERPPSPPQGTLGPETSFVGC